MNLMKLLAGAATPAMIGKVAGMLGVSSPAVQKMLAVAVPVILSGLLGAAKKPEGREAFGRALGHAGDNPLDDLAAELDRDPASVAKGGSDFLSSMLGGGTLGTLASKLGDFGGVPQDKAGSLLGLAGSLAMGGLARTAKDQNLDADGVLKYMESQKSEIADAIPPEVRNALGGTGVLAALDLPQSAAKPATGPAATPRAPTPKPAPPPAKGSSWTKWLIGIVALLLLLWLLSRLFGGAPEEAVVEEEAEPAVVEEVEEAEPAEEAAAETPADTEVNALVVDGVDIGASVQGALDELTSTLAGVTDAASAEAALPTITGIDDTLATVQTAAANLGDEGSSALQSLIMAIMPTIRTEADRILGDSALAGVLQPALDGVLAKLEALAG